MKSGVALISLLLITCGSCNNLFIGKPPAPLPKAEKDLDFVLGKQYKFNSSYFIIQCFKLSPSKAKKSSAGFLWKYQMEFQQSQSVDLVLFKLCTRLLSTRIARMLTDLIQIFRVVLEGLSLNYCVYQIRLTFIQTNWNLNKISTNCKLK